MELFTRSYIKEWDRIVHIIVLNDKGISNYIKDGTTYKFVLLEKGEIYIVKNNVKTTVKAPAYVLVSNCENADISCNKSARTQTILFNPSVIREEFVLGQIEKIDYEEHRGSTLYQDYILIADFLRQSDSCHATVLPITVFYKIKGIIDSMNNELILQKDGYWPCRSRSYLLELLYLIGFKEEDNKQDESKSDIEFGLISDYLHEHINEEVTLERVTADLSINRNRLNELFHEKTGMTCLNFLTHMRMELASILLVETDLRIGEICERIGYDDANYFTKAFKKETGMTPSVYRKEKRK